MTDKEENNSESCSVDSDLLRASHNENDPARWLFEHLASCERPWVVMKVDRLLQRISERHPSLARSELIGVLRILEMAGCGKFIVGRRSKPSRFEWSVSLVAVGQVAIGEKEVISEDDCISGDFQDDGDDWEGSGLADHSFRVRSDLTIQMKLPGNLTQAEAKRIAAFVRTLPLGD